MCIISQQSGRGTGQRGRLTAAGVMASSDHVTRWVSSEYSSNTSFIMRRAQVNQRIISYLSKFLCFFFQNSFNIFRVHLLRVLRLGKVLYHAPISNGSITLSKWPRMTSVFAENSAEQLFRFQRRPNNIMMTELAKTIGISSGQNRAINEQSMLKLNTTVVNSARLIKIPLSKLMTVQISDLLFSNQVKYY